MFSNYCKGVFMCHFFMDISIKTVLFIHTKKCHKKVIFRVKIGKNKSFRPLRKHNKLSQTTRNIAAFRRRQELLEPFLQNSHSPKNIKIIIFSPSQRRIFAKLIISFLSHLSFLLSHPHYPLPSLTGRGRGRVLYYIRL